MAENGFALLGLDHPVLVVILRPSLLRRVRVSDEAAVGFALGVASYGLGTARAFEIAETTGTFAGLGMALNSVATSVIVPTLARMLIR
jgi:putative effector of murein hydrolase